MKKTSIVLLVLTAVSLTSSAYAGEILVNGSFEDGMFGWTTTGNVYAHPEYTVPNPFQVITPTDGTLMAVLGAGQSLDATLAQGFSTGALGPVTISFDYNYAAIDSTFADVGLDSLSIWVDNFNLATLQINDFWDGRGVRQGWSVLGWQTYSQTFYNVPAGTFRIQFNLANTPGTGGESSQIAVAFLDNVSVDGTRVPEPSSLLLLGSGLLGLGLMARKALF